MHSVVAFLCVHVRVCLCASRPNIHGGCSHLVDSALQGLSAHRGDQCSDRAGVEAGKGEPQTAVHAVRSELQRLLADVQLLLLDGVALFLQNVLHLSTAVH